MNFILLFSKKNDFANNLKGVTIKVINPRNKLRIPDKPDKKQRISMKQNIINKNKRLFKSN